MRMMKRGIVILAITALFTSTSQLAVNAQSNVGSLHSVEKSINSNQTIIQKKEEEQQAVNKDLNRVMKEWESLQAIIQKNKDDISAIEGKIKSVNQVIEKKKEEIVGLEDQVLARKDILKKRLVALQKNGRMNFVLETLLDSESFDDLVNRISAITTLLSADNQILVQQQADLKKIEEDKKEITRQEEELTAERKKLAESQVKLQANLQTKQETITTLQSKYKNINTDLVQAEKNKSSLESQLSRIQDNIKKEEAAAKSRALDEQRSIQAPPRPENKKDLYVTATAYSYQDTKGHITTSGYDIRKNPNMKLIAVDPAVIPLGSKVWVEGYGVAIAGDTGSAIVGHRIDILMPSHKDAVSWGRRTIKINILN